MTANGRVLMVQGTASSAGKSLLVTGLCRLFAQEGVVVAPFKAQNMSNNAFVTIEGHEIGRAQAVQAQAARLIPHVDMNPILLKPEADHRAQVIVMGRPLATLPAAAYQLLKDELWGAVTAALDRLRSQYDLVIVEGAGSPAEINLKARDITNMRVALYAQAPVLLVGDIDRGGVFAHLFGTHALLDPPEQALVRGLVINKLRGDPALLEPGLADIERLTGVPVVGVVPWIRDLRIPEEDSVALDRRREPGGSFEGVDVAVLRFPRIANFDDFDPLEAETDVRVRYVAHPEQFGDPDLVILPGTKATVADLQWLCEGGFDRAIRAAIHRDAAVIGICGGFQMLGARIDDPERTEASVATVAGLGLLEVVTSFSGQKRTRQCTAVIASADGLLAGAAGMRVAGYEIHLGRTTVSGSPAVLLDDGMPIGAADTTGWVFGCYLHGLFHTDPFRRSVLANVAARRGKRYRASSIEHADKEFERLAEVLRSSLDLPAIFRLAGLRL